MPEPIRYTTVLFDLDHTLMDSDASAQEAFDVTMRSIGVDPSPDVFAVYDRINQALWRQVESGGLSPNDVKLRRFQTLSDELGVDADPEHMADTFVGVLTDHGDLYDGVRQLLDLLAGQVRMGMVTNGIGPVQRGRIARLDIGRYFDAIVVSGELGVAKPNPVIFDHVLNEMEVVDRSGVVMVGDSLVSDIAGANNACVDSIWFDRHGSGESALSTHRVTSVAELSMLFRRSEQ